MPDDLKTTLMKVYQIAGQLPEQDRAILLRKFYEQRMLGNPEFTKLYPTMQERAGVHKDFTGEDMLYAPEPGPNAGQRILGQYQNPMTLNPLTHLGNAMTFFGTPGRAVKEGVDAGMDAAGMRNPNKGGTAIGPGAYLPDTLGGWAQLPADFYANPLMMRVLASPFTAAGAERRWGQGIEEGIRGAQAENAGWNARWGQNAPKALPANAGPTTPPWAMPGRVYSPYELEQLRVAQAGQHAPRPPELMPKQRGGGQVLGRAPYDAE